MGGNRRKNSNSRFIRAEDVFRKHGGILRTSQILREGIHPDTLYTMHDSGIIVTVSRGVYRLSDNPPLSNPDLVTVSMRIPAGVICLISSLSFHDLTTQIPHEVHVALPKGAEEPRLDHPPVRAYRFSAESFREGVDTHELDGTDVRIYNPEKTLADCFKFRNRIGLDTAIEALRLYRDKGDLRVDSIMRYASICRVEKIIRPYLEAIL